MTKIKLCGLSRACDIEAVNELKPEYVGFVFAARSKRYVSPDQAAGLRSLLAPKIQSVGVFVNEEPERIARLMDQGIIDIAQLHGQENETYIGHLKQLTGRQIIKAFCIEKAEDIKIAEQSTADYVLLDSGQGSGTRFDWELLKLMKRPYFLAGGLSPENVAAAAAMLHPFAVDVSSGIETDGVKDREKMAAFVAAVREVDRL